MDRTVVQDFMLRYLSAAGRAPEELEPGVWRVARPGAAPIEITFDAEAAAEKSDRELVTLGSPLLDEALHATLAAGRVLHLYAPERRADPALFESRLRARMTFDRVRCAGLEVGREMEGRVYRIHFVVSIHADVVQQLACPVWVDGTTGRAAEAYGAEWSRLAFEDARRFVLPLDAEADPARVLSGALAELHRHTATRLRALEGDLARQREDEERRVRAYFRDREDELARAGRGKDGAPEGRSAEVLAALHAERDMRLKDTELRYRPRLDARIAAVEVIHTPRLVGSLLVQMGAATFRLAVRYDALLGVASLPDCPTCDQAAETLIGQRDAARPGCAACMRPPEPAPQPAPSPPPPPPPGPPAPRPPAASARRAHTPSRTASRADRRGLEAGPLRIRTDVWLLLVRTGSAAGARQFGPVRLITDRVAREVLAAMDRGYGLPALRVDEGAGGALYGSGLWTALCEPLFRPDQLIADHVELMRDVASERARGTKVQRGQRFLSSYSMPGTNDGAVDAGGTLFHLRALVAFAVGPVAAHRGRLPVPELEAGVARILARELGLTGASDGVQVLEVFDQVGPCVHVARECRRKLVAGRGLTSRELIDRCVALAQEMGPWGPRTW